MSHFTHFGRFSDFLDLFLFFNHALKTIQLAIFVFKSVFGFEFDVCRQKEQPVLQLVGHHLPFGSCAAKEEDLLQLLWFVYGGILSVLMKLLRGLQDVFHPLLNRFLIIERFNHLSGQDVSCDRASLVDSSSCQRDDILSIDFAVLTMKLKPHCIEVCDVLSWMSWTLKLTIFSAPLLLLCLALLLLQLLYQELIA